MNPYTVFNIRKDASLKNLKGIWMFITKSSEEDYQKLMNSVQEDTEKREIILDKIIEAEYKLLYQEASNFVKRSLSPNASFEEREQATQERRNKLANAYNMISTREKRENYEKMQKNQQSSQSIQTPKIVPMRSRVEMIQQEIEAILKKGIKTQNTFSEEELKKLTSENKRRLDSKNEFPNFSGAELKWAIKMDYEELLSNTCLVNEINEKGEQVFVSILGDFQYQSLIHGPNRQNPQGIYGKDILEGIKVLGITKSNSKGEILTNEIRLSRLNHFGNEGERNFLKDVYFSNEVMNSAKQQNEGFMGNVIHQGNSQNYSVECNNPGDNKAVNALRIANMEQGKFYIVKEGQLWYQKNPITWLDVEDRLKRFHLTYRKAFPEPVRKKVQPMQKFRGKEREEDQWAK